jgi:hypothetical protein
MLLWNDPAVPPEVKEGLRFLSATRIGCAYCRTVREHDHGGRRLLDDAFYEAVASGSSDWSGFVGMKWAPLFDLAGEVLDGGEVSPSVVARAREGLTDEEIVQATFFMLVIGASHRFSRAFGVEAACPVPTTIRSEP